MPFMAVETWGASKEAKNQFIKRATAWLIKQYNIPPDKIQFLFRDIPQENWGKAGAVPTDADFAEKSRLTDWETQASYHDGESEIHNMAVIAIDSWNVYNADQKDAWAKMLTDLSVELLNVPADNVLFLFRDMVPGNWGQTGYTGNHAEFLTKSRQIINPQDSKVKA